MKTSKDRRKQIEKRFVKRKKMDKGPEKLKDVMHHFFELCNTFVHEGQ